MNLLDLPIEILEDITRRVLSNDTFDNFSTLIMVCRSFRYLAKQLGLYKNAAVNALIPKLKETRKVTSNGYSYTIDRLEHRVNRMYGFNFDKLVIKFLRNKNEYHFRYPTVGDRHIRTVKRGLINMYLQHRCNAAIDRIDIEGILAMIPQSEKRRYMERKLIAARYESPIAITRSRVNKLVSWYNESKTTIRWRQIYKSTIDILISKKTVINHYVKCVSKPVIVIRSDRELCELAAIFDKIYKITLMKRLCLYIASIYINMYTYCEVKHNKRSDIFEYVLVNTPRGKTGVNIIVTDGGVGKLMTRDQLQYSADVLAKFVCDTDNPDVKKLATVLAKASFGFKAALTYYNMFETFMSKNTANMVINTLHRLKRKATADENRLEISAVQYFREFHDESFDRLEVLMELYNRKFNDTFRKVIKPTTRGGKRVREKYQRMLVGRKQFNTAYKKYLLCYDMRSAISLIDRKFRTHTIAYLVHVT